MKKKNILLLILVVVIILILALVILFAVNPTRDIDVKVLEIYDQNNQYFVNISIKNNQDTTGWISNMYLSTFQGSTIDLTGAGAGFKIEPGKTISLTLMSAETHESITDPPFTLTYTAFPSGKEYYIEI